MTIHKHNKNTLCTKLNRIIQNIQPYIYIYIHTHTHTHTHTMIKMEPKEYERMVVVVGGGGGGVLPVVEQNLRLRRFTGCTRSSFWKR